MSPPRNRGRDLALVGLLFAISGAAALVYQVAWQRILSLHTGISVHSVATIVAAFMLGLGVGSEWGGALSARVSARRALSIFAGIELAIGGFAVCSPWLYYDVLYQRAGFLYASPLTAVPAQLLALLPPTTLMGMSLPFLVRAIVRDRDEKSGTIAFLYGVNVTGAALGALLTPWVLERLVGVAGAVWVAATLNVCVGLGALALGAVGNAETTPGAAEAPSAPRSGRPEVRLLALYGLAGFCSLGLEIVWFRIVDVAVKSTAFTFGTVLAIFLAGLASGGFLGGALAARIKDPLRVFLLCECGVLAFAAAAVSALVRLPPGSALLSFYESYWPSYGGFELGLDWDPVALAWLYLALPLALYFVPTLLMGVAFVALQRLVQSEASLAGHRVGSLQAANIAGGVAGSLGVGLALLPLVGTAGTLRLLVALGLVFAGIGLHSGRGRRGFAAAAAGLLALLVLLPSQRQLWLRLHGAPASALVDEDASGVVALTPRDDRHQMMVNGKGISWLPYGGIHSVMGAVPALVHSRPEQIAIVGLGSGDTAWAALLREATAAAVVFEISAPQPRLLRAFSAREADPALQRLLSDARLSIRIADGRNALEREAARFDVIQADPLPPGGAGSGNLYSLEFFQAAARRLKPGGIMCSWAPTPRVLATFCRAFPWVIELTHGQFQFLIGSEREIAIDPETWIGRLSGAPSLYLGQRISQEVEASLRTARLARPSETIDVDLNRDLFPRDELRLP